MIDLQRFSWKTFAVALVAAGIAFAGLLFVSREYTSTALFVVSPRSDASAETFANDLGFLAGTSAFYDRLLIEHPAFSDPVEGASYATREAAWKRVLHARIPDGTSVIELSVSADTPEQSEALLRASLETLSGFSDRLVGSAAHSIPVGEIVTAVSARNVVVASCVALVIGLFVAILFMRTGRRFSDVHSYIERPVRSENALGKKSNRTESILRPVGFFGAADLETERKTIQAQPAKKEQEEKGKEVGRVIEIPKSLGQIPAQKISSEEEKKEKGETSSLPKESQISETETKKEQVTVPVPDVSKVTQVQGLEEVPSTQNKKQVSSFSQVQQKTEESRVLRAIEMKRLERSVPAPSPSELPSIPASEFTWEKYLFANEDKNGKSEIKEEKKEEAEENVSVSRESVAEPIQESVSSETKTISSPIEKREPTQEELKARLNALLRGEL